MLRSVSRATGRDAAQVYITHAHPDHSVLQAEWQRTVMHLYPAVEDGIWGK